MIVFKQTYKPVGSGATPGLNVRHLQYISTRPGAVFNQDCGFSLWGKPPGKAQIRDIQNLDEAKQILRDISEKRTVYRAIVSVNKKDAQEHDLYNRRHWEQLVENHAPTIAREMNIRPENFCWYAAMHYASGHPHIHMVYWDNGNDPRPEHISRERFEIMAEHIRADFGREVYRDELASVQDKQKEEQRALRSELRAMCLEANPEAAINLARMHESAQTALLSERLAYLAENCPAKGSLRYAYLPPDYKKMVDDLVEECLAVPELQKQYDRFLQATRSISQLYGNGETALEQNLNKAVAKLRTELGNEVMTAVRELLRENVPASRLELKEVLGKQIAALARQQPSYQKLLEMMPRERIPWAEMEKQMPGYGDRVQKISEAIAMDPRLKLQIRGWIEQQISAAGLEKGSEEAEAIRKEAWRDTYREINQGVNFSLRQDAGWYAEAAQTNALGMLCSMVQRISRLASQKEAAHGQARLAAKSRSKDKSKEAKKDYAATNSQAGAWEQD